MIHRDYHKVAHVAAVRRAADSYRAAWRRHDGTYARGLACKEAETTVNAAVEAAIAPRER